MSDDKKLVREETTTNSRRRRGRVERAEGDERSREETGDRRRGRGRSSHRRSPLRQEVTDIQRGAMYAGIEAAAATMDIMSHLMRNAVDRAFAKDYREPGDLLRGLTRDTGDVLHDAVDEAKDMPQRVNDSFYEAVPRRRTRDRGERHRRAQRAHTGAEDEE